LRLLDRFGANEQQYSARLLQMFTDMLLEYEEFQDVSSFGLSRHKVVRRNVTSLIVQLPSRNISINCEPTINGNQLSLLIASKFANTK
jgi:hypothetical protein